MQDKGQCKAKQGAAGQRKAWQRKARRGKAGKREARRGRATQDQAVLCSGRMGKVKKSMAAQSMTAQCKTKQGIAR